MPDTHYTEWFRFTSEALPEDSFHVIRFSGTEGLNRLFSFTIDLASRNADIDAEAMLNAPAAFTILREGDADPAVFRGYPSRVEQGGHFGDYTFYTVELRPAFWKLTRLKGSAVFVNRRLRDAAAEVLRSQQFFKFDHEFRLTREYPVPEFAMQYQESLFDYLLFRMEQQGVYFFFAPDGDRVIFADAPQSHQEAAAKLAYSPASGLDHARREEVLQSFAMARTPLPRQVVLRCYDWKNPNRVIVGKADVSATGLGDVYLAGENAETEAEAKRLAKIRAEELICRGRLFTGSGSVPGLRPGLVFSLENHYSASFNRDYMVTEITHEGTQESYVTLGLGIPLGRRGQDAPDHYFYRNHFTCIPADVQYRPERTAPRATIPGVIHAFVDGAANKRAERDEYGRYKLVFPFDLSGRKQGNASCWIRMAGPQTGRDSGLAFPLLPGTEVVVSFVDGDPDRPVITGALANGETGSIGGRGNADISGIRTAGGNQITINDTDKKQGLALTTAAGLGYNMSSGSLGFTSENADLYMKCAALGGAEVSTAFKDVVSGFKVSSAASRDPGWSGWFNTAAAAVSSGGTAIVEALSERANKDEKAVLKWVNDGLKLLVPVTTMIDDVKSAIEDDGASYGVSLKAEADESKSTLLVRPSKTKLTAATVAWIGARVAAFGLSTAVSGMDIADGTKEKAKKEFDECVEAAVGKLHEDEEKYKGKSYDYEGDADGGRKYANVTHDLDELIGRRKRAGEDVDDLEEIKEKLEKAWARYGDDESDDYYNNAKWQAVRDIATSTVTELTPEIVAMIVLIMGRRKMAASLGGVSISSGDNNINIRAQKAVSVHTETGILLDTAVGMDDAGKWGRDDTDYKAKAGAGGMDGWAVTGGTVSTFFPANADPTKKFVSADTELFSVHADYHLSSTTNEWISQASTHTLRTDADATPKAQVKMTDADKTIAASVAADGKILLIRGDAKPKLELSDAGGVLANGADVQLKLTEEQALLKTEGSDLTLKKNATELKGDNASVLCKKNEIVLDPTAAGKTVVSGVTFKRTDLSADGVMQLQAGMIKIG